MKFQKFILSQVGCHSGPGKVYMKRDSWLFIKGGDGEIPTISSGCIVDVHEGVPPLTLVVVQFS